MNNEMTEIGGANYAGFRSDSHILYLFRPSSYNYVVIEIDLVIQHQFN